MSADEHIHLFITCPYHSTVCDKTNKSVLREKAQAHDEGLLEGGQAVGLLAQIDDIEENRRSGSRS